MCFGVLHFKAKVNQENDGSSKSLKDSSFSKRVPKSSAIKVIDLGRNTYDRQSYIVSTSHYRAPEVILGHVWSYPCDIWSVGCILVELCSGEALFQTYENLEHLAMKERVLDPLPSHMLKKDDRHAEKYVRKGRLEWPKGATSRESIKAVLKLPRLHVTIDSRHDISFFVFCKIAKRTLQEGIQVKSEMISPNEDDSIYTTQTRATNGLYYKGPYSTIFYKKLLGLP
ncbi:serine/threonine-protein kinase AFC2-like protein isoform X3 [Tanacetum coccineum]